MKNPIYKITGVSEEMEIASPAGRGLLMIFSLFVIISVGLTFTCWYLFFDNSNMSFIGIALGIVFAIIILLLDKGLFAEGKQLFILIVTRVIIIAVLAFVISYVFGIALADETLENKIDETNAKSGLDIDREIQDRRDTYDLELQKINERVLVEVKKSPKNEKSIREVYNEMKADLHDAFDDVKFIEKQRKGEISYGIFEKITAYNNLPRKMRFNKFYWLFFIIEILPLIIRISYILVEDD